MCTLVYNERFYLFFFFLNIMDNFHSSYVFCQCNKSHYSVTKNFIDFNGKSYQQIIVKIKAECCKNHR